MNFSGVLGLIVFWGLLALAVIMGGNPVVFISIPSIVIVVGVAFGAGLMAFGVIDLRDGLLALRALVIRVPDEALRHRQAEVLRGLIPPTYAAGAIGTLIGGVQMLASMDDPSQIGAGLAVAILTVLYSFLLSDGLLRPGARHIEHRLKADA